MTTRFDLFRTGLAAILLVFMTLYPLGACDQAFDEPLKDHIHPAPWPTDQPAEDDQGDDADELATTIAAYAATPADICNALGTFCGGLAVGVPSGRRDALYRCSAVGQSGVGVSCAIQCVDASSAETDFCGRQLLVKSADLNLLATGSYTAVPNTRASVLNWVTGQYLSVTTKLRRTLTLGGSVVAATQVTGPNGTQCVDYVKGIVPWSGVAGSAWYRGRKVVDGRVPKGAAIATFRADGKYEGHTGIFLGLSGTGLLISDENWGNASSAGLSLVKRHPIDVGASRVEKATEYYEILVR